MKQIHVILPIPILQFVYTLLSDPRVSDLNTCQSSCYSILSILIHIIPFTLTRCRWAASCIIWTTSSHGPGVGNSHSSTEEAWQEASESPSEQRPRYSYSPSSLPQTKWVAVGWVHPTMVNMIVTGKMMSSVFLYMVMEDDDQGLLNLGLPCHLKGVSVYFTSHGVYVAIICCIFLWFFGGGSSLCTGRQWWGLHDNIARFITRTTAPIHPSLFPLIFSVYSIIICFKSAVF